MLLGILGYQSSNDMQFEISEFEILSILQIGGDVDSISRTVTCTGELSALTCVVPRGKDFIPPVEIIIPGKCTRYFSCPRLSKLTTVVFVPCLCTVLSTLCIGRSQ